MSSLWVHVRRCAIQFCALRLATTNISGPCLSWQQDANWENFHVGVQHVSAGIFSLVEIYSLCMIQPKVTASFTPELLGDM